MSILLAVSPDSTALSAVEWLEIAAGAAVAVFVAWMVGAFRRGSIAGPLRVPAGKPAGVLWLTAIAGFGATIFAQAAFLSMTKTPPGALSLHQTVVISVFATMAGLAMMLLAHALQGPATLEQLGLGTHAIPRGVIAGMIGSCVAIPMMFAATAIVQEIWRRLGLLPPEEHILLKVFGESAVPIDRVLVVLSAVVLAPLFEEFLFRAHIQTAVTQISARPWLGVLIASALFALAHGVLWMMPPLFMLAICLGYTYERTGNLWASIVMHASFNAVSISIEYWTTVRH